MTGKDIYRNMSGINPQFILEAAPKEENAKFKARGWMKRAAMAACLCLLVVASFRVWWREASIGQGDGNEITISEDGVVIPKRDISLSNNADMIGFFIYQGNCYVQYEQFNNADNIVGDYLGTATGLIDEWTPQDGYVELAGSVKGDFFSVKGYDPSFMLCMKCNDGQISTYVCSTGLTVKYGSELYEDKLHLAENYSGVQFETRESWYQGKGEICTLNNGMDIVALFLDALNAAEFIPWTSVPDMEGVSANAIYDTEIYHVYFQMDNGMVVHLRLYENGYVRFQGMPDICVQLTQEAYAPFVRLLDCAA